MLDTRTFPPEILAKYPHMFPGDIEIWNRFLAAYLTIYSGFQYDIMCGQECEQFPRWETPYRKDAAVLSRLRIDAVGHRPDGIDVIEVKPRAGAQAIGQVLTYVEHYKEDYKPSLPVRGVIVTGQEDRNIPPIAEKHHIAYIVV